MGFHMLLWGYRAENGVSLDWSPDGRHLLTATTAPRLRVDNGYQMYRCASSSNTCTDPPGSHIVQCAHYRASYQRSHASGVLCAQCMMNHAKYLRSLTKIILICTPLLDCREQQCIWPFLPYFCSRLISCLLQVHRREAAG